MANLTHVYRQGKPAGVTIPATGTESLWPGEPWLASPLGQVPLLPAGGQQEEEKHERREGD